MSHSLALKERLVEIFNEVEKLDIITNTFCRNQDA